MRDEVNEALYALRAALVRQREDLNASIADVDHLLRRRQRGQMLTEPGTITVPRKGQRIRLAKGRQGATPGSGKKT